MKRFAAGIRPDTKTPPLVGVRPPRCPPFVEITSSDQLLPYLEHVARRPYNNGLNACWDLKPGERVMLRVDNWHSELVIEACKKILEKYKVKYTIKSIDRGPIRQWVGADEVDYYLFRTKRARGMDGHVGGGGEEGRVRQDPDGLRRPGAGRAADQDPAHAVHHARDPGLARPRDADRGPERHRPLDLGPRPHRQARPHHRP